MEQGQQIFNIFCILFLLWMCFKSDGRALWVSVFKVVLFIIAIIGIVIELKYFQLIQ